MTGADGRIRDCNLAFARWLGVSARRLVDQPLAALEVQGDALARFGIGLDQPHDEACVRWQRRGKACEPREPRRGDQHRGKHRAAAKASQARGRPPAPPRQGRSRSRSSRTAIRVVTAGYRLDRSAPSASPPPCTAVR